ncbi:MAG: glycosyltransferase family 4 protein [Anaerolineae bacterium]|nr:glycosyltransferase family 4 protein [Anaerolineae bacterium]
MPGLVVVLVSRVRLNPYVRLLAQALRRLEPEAAVREARDVSVGRALAGAGRPRIWHLHWPELLYRSPRGAVAAVRWARFALALACFRATGGRLVYTVHNLDPHEWHHPRLDRWTAGLVRRWAHAIHVHDRQAQAEVARRWGRPDAVVVPHGNYIGAYPQGCRRPEARQRLGLPQEAFVFLCLGGLRPYKGVEELVAAFRALADAAPRAWLVVVGHAHDPAYADGLAAALADVPRARLVPRHIPDEEVQCYMAAADFAVFPYRRATTSGAAILALSFGVPVVAPALGPFPELLAQGGGILYPPQQEAGLLGALRAALHADREGMARQAWAVAQALDWETVAQGFWGIYRGLVGGEGEGGA